MQFYRSRYFFIFLLIALSSIFFSISQGSSNIPLDLILTSLISPDESLNSVLIWDLRLPRTLGAFACGALLSLAGLLMQLLIRNPLADPYVLGVSGGASCFSIIAIIFGLGGLSIHFAAFIGAISSSLLVYLLARQNSQFTSHRILLTGIVLASGWGALISFLLIISPAEKLPGILFWMMGDLSHIDNILPLYLVLFMGATISIALAPQLNALSWGEIYAKTLGISTQQIMLILFITSSALTATAVTNAGAIGFVGLVIPHLMRLIVGIDNQILIPSSILFGGSLLVISDTLARTAFSPQQLPVGILTASIGVPIFLYLLYRKTN